MNALPIVLTGMLCVPFLFFVVVICCCHWHQYKQRRDLQRHHSSYFKQWRYGCATEWRPAWRLDRNDIIFYLVMAALFAFAIYCKHLA